MNNHGLLKEGIQQVSKILQDIIARLGGWPLLEFGIIPMLLALVGLVIFGSLPGIPWPLVLLPFAFLIFGLLVILVHLLLPHTGKDLQQVFNDVKEQNLSQDELKQRISTIADFDWRVVGPRVKLWADLQGAINPYDLGPKNWERCLYDLGLPGGRKHTLEYDKSGRLKYQ